MKETFYLFEFVDGTSYEMTCAISFKDGVWEMAKYTGAECDLLFKCLNGFDDEDVNGIVDIFNHFSSYSIEKVYQIEKVVYDKNKRG